MLRLRLQDQEQFLILRGTNDFSSLKLNTPVELLLQICDQYWAATAALTTTAAAAMKTIPYS